MEVIEKHEQGKVIFKLESEEEFNIKHYLNEGTKKVSDFSFESIIKDLENDELVNFLDHQVKDNPYDKVIVLLSSKLLYNNSRCSLDQKEILDSWIGKQINLPKIFRRKAFTLFFENLNYHDLNTAQRIQRVGLFINKKNIEEGIRFLQHGKKTLVQLFNAHKIICERPYDCSTNIKFEDFIAGIDELIETAQYQKEQASKDTSKNTNPEFTTARQVLALYYLFTYLKLDFEFVNKTDLARFTQFLTGKEANNKTISNTEIYKKWLKVLNKRDKEQVQDLEYIKQYFNKLHLSEVIKAIDNDIDSFKS